MKLEYLLIRLQYSVKYYISFLHGAVHHKVWVVEYIVEP